ncbi:MAG: hypothetical protein GWP11_00690 [Proteobacteria bacterium]|nr:hypothetical protein [Pseudomonadota bacterium]
MYCSWGWAGGGWNFIIILFWGALILGGIALAAAFLARKKTGVPEEHICPSCGGPVRSMYLRCPHCGGHLKKHCPSCSRLVQVDWKYCPDCQAKLDDQTP